MPAEGIVTNTGSNQPHQTDSGVTAPARRRRDLPRLNLVTPETPSTATLDALDAILGVVPVFVQVRTKAVDDRARLEFARQVIIRCRVAGAPCVINDRVDIALAAKADGVHLGDDDLPVDEARLLLGDDAIIGATCRNPDRARAAQALGADYLGVGPCFVSTTKPGAVAPLGPEGLAAVTAAVDVPVVAISGVTPDNAASLVAAGAHGVAVVSAVFAADNPTAAASAFHQIVTAGPPPGRGDSR
jgi:thiamine-phosphate pyrophosphorylase